ncbi:MAG: aminofutalosine synthase MqnE [Bacteroidetes bacterium]|nr:aminofutalosine synthase MqnE [Bacteroidota bacterium]
MFEPANLDNLLDFGLDHPELERIARNVQRAERLTPAEGLYLFQNADLGLLGAMANAVRERLHGDVTYFNRNFHIEPTNLCVFDCKFCSYSRLIKQKDEGWIMDKDQILHIVRRYEGQPVTEVHIVGGVLPQMNLAWFGEVLEGIKALRPDLHIKGFTAVELEYMFRKAKVSIEEGLRFLMSKGLGSLPGGGAEIFDETVRQEICADKCNTATWLEIHETAHKLGMKSNATMLYGHIETYAHRIDHMQRLRELQDRTGGFNTFIPLKFRNQGNQMSHVAETTLIEDLKTYAVARVFLDNIPHLKAYWPMLGRESAQLTQAFGVNDLDGTIDDSTKIYSMAGSEEQNPSLSTEELVELIRAVGRRPAERDTLYGTVRDYADDLVEQGSKAPSNQTVQTAGA